MNIFELILDFILISLAGLFIAFSPLLIITDLLIVLKSKRPILHAVVLLLSIALPLLLLAFVVGYLVDPAQNITLSAINDKLTVPPLLNAVLGGVVLVVGVRKFLNLKYRPLQPVQGPKPERKPPAKVVPLFIFGFMKTLFSLTNVFAILFVTRLITSNKLGPLLALMVLFWTIAVGLVPFFVIFYYQKNKRDYLLQIQANLDKRMSNNLKAYGWIGVAALGGILATSGITHIIQKF